MQQKATHKLHDATPTKTPAVPPPAATNHERPPPQQTKQRE
jgi:hypothetical protein